MKYSLKEYLSYAKYDLPSGLVVFLVALPLCLGIALASGAPLFSGLITGITAGIVAGLLSGSQVAVSGPAAGLTVIVLNAITTLGSFEAFLVAVVLAGLIQLTAGLLKAGIISTYFPSSVIKGMLAAIGLILIYKQIPYFLGVGQDLFTDMGNAFASMEVGALIVGVVALTILLLWERPFIKKNKILGTLPGALVAVVTGILLNQLFVSIAPELAITQENLVSIPEISSFSELKSELPSPDFSQFTNPQIYVVAITIAIVASLETLLSIEATDKLDPLKRKSSTDQELVAQGVGNTIAGLIGGLPMTAVIVRSSTNIAAGGKTRVAPIFHGILLIGCVLTIPHILNMFPLAALAAVLLTVGYKLSKVSIYVQMYKAGKNQFIPFIVTVLAILFTDLLVGIAIGMAVGIFFILRENVRRPFVEKPQQENGKTLIKLSEHISFLNKGSIVTILDRLPENSELEIDGAHSRFIDRDILETIHNFRDTAQDKNIKMKLKNIPDLRASSNGSH